MKSGFKWLGAAAMAATMAAGAVQAADASSLYYERAFVRAADARCGVSPGSKLIKATLNSSPTFSRILETARTNPSAASLQSIGHSK